MQRQQSFGRRAPTQREAPKPAPSLRPEPTDEVRPAPALLVRDPDAEIDREVEEWKAMRKIRKRSFREPWRSVCIAASVGFGVSTWMLPDSVETVAQLVTTGLAAASFFAGYRKR